MPTMPADTRKQHRDVWDLLCKSQGRQRGAECEKSDQPLLPKEPTWRILLNKILLQENTRDIPNNFALSKTTTTTKKTPENQRGSTRSLLARGSDCVQPEALSSGGALGCSVSFQPGVEESGLSRFLPLCPPSVIVV